MRYAHTNLIARDWRRLARFYEEVFQCVPVPPERELTGAWLDAGTGVSGAHLRGVHLRLPGHGPSGPTLEVFAYDERVDEPLPVANQVGLRHLAFEVEDVRSTASAVVAAGGHSLGDVVTREVPGAGALTFVYVRDPEGNLIELQRWAR